MATKAPVKSKKRMSVVGRDVLTGLREYTAYKLGEKTGAKLYTFPTIPEDVCLARRARGCEKIRTLDPLRYRRGS